MSKHLNEAVDKALQRLYNKTHAGTNQLWLFAPKGMPRELRNELNAEGSRPRNVPGPIKEALRKFWDFEYAVSARKY